MASDGIIRIQDNDKYDFDPSKLCFREPKVMSSGAKLVMLAYGEGKTSNQVVIETPTLRAPMGKSEWENPTGPSKHSIMLSLDDMDSRKDVAAFQQLLEAIDNLAMTAGFENSMGWFRKVYKNSETVKDMYQPLERKSRDKETGEFDGRWPPSVKVTLPYGPDGKPKFTTYNSAQEEIDISTIDSRNANVTAIVVLQSIWMAGNMFGISLKAVQLLVEPKRTMAACAFRNLMSRPQAQDAAAGKKALAQEPELLESSDDEELVPNCDV